MCLRFLAFSCHIKETNNYLDTYRLANSNDDKIVKEKNIYSFHFLKDFFHFKNLQQFRLVIKRASTGKNGCNDMRLFISWNIF